MAHYLDEPVFSHGEPARTGILLINLGTPEAPTAGALRPYLRQFLSDRRVIEIPRALWWLILHGVILNLRPGKSAKKYALIWSPEGSPLLVHTRKQALLLRGHLASRTSSDFVVEYAMRYGAPSVASALQKLKEKRCDKILVVPLYPQYAASSTASALDDVWRTLLRTRNMPAIRTVRSYHDHPSYIAALADSVRQHWAQHDRPEKLIISFHGVPRRTLDKGDPYYCECQKTGRLLAEALQLTEAQYLICFQSRFGRAEWLQPYLAPTLAALGKRGLKRIDVICPGFSSDCLETLEEIAIEGRETFQDNGGGDYHYIPALNERESWIRALCDIVEENLAGWLDVDGETSRREAGQSRQRALRLGAKS